MFLLVLLWSGLAWPVDPPHPMFEVDPEWVTDLESGQVVVVVEGPEGPAWEVGDWAEASPRRPRKNRSRRRDEADPPRRGER